MGGWMRPTDAIASGLRKTFTKAGRASRSEYWYYLLFGCAATIGLDALATLLAPVRDRVAEEIIRIKANSNAIPIEVDLKWLLLDVLGLLSAILVKLGIIIIGAPSILCATV